MPGVAQRDKVPRAGSEPPAWCSPCHREREDSTPSVQPSPCTLSRWCLLCSAGISVQAPYYEQQHRASRPHSLYVSPFPNFQRVGPDSICCNMSYGQLPPLQMPICCQSFSAECQPHELMVLNKRLPHFIKLGQMFINSTRHKVQ